MLTESPPNRLTIMEGDITMQVPSTDFEARLSALETYVGRPRERTGMTITSRLEAQHSLLQALHTGQNETNRRLSSVEGRLTKVEGRLTSIEDVLGKVLQGMTVITSLLMPPDDPTANSRLNGSSPP